MAALSVTQKSIPSQEVLLALFRYEPGTGRLFWRERPLSMFKAERHWKSWNTAFAGKEASQTSDAYGYTTVCIFDRKQKTHRVICTMIYGDLIEDVDHINGNRADNRLGNLRVVSHDENQRNVAMPVTNTSGTVGVCWHKAGQKWHAQIKRCGKNISLGLFDNIEDAIAARKAAEVKFGFHVNHGRQPSSP